MEQIYEDAGFVGQINFFVGWVWRVDSIVLEFRVDWGDFLPSISNCFYQYLYLLSKYYHQLMQSNPTPTLPQHPSPISLTPISTNSDTIVICQPSQNPAPDVHAHIEGNNIPQLHQSACLVVVPDREAQNIKLSQDMVNFREAENSRAIVGDSNNTNQEISPRNTQQTHNISQELSTLQQKIDQNINSTPVFKSQIPPAPPSQLTKQLIHIESPLQLNPPNPDISVVVTPQIYTSGLENGMNVELGQTVQIQQINPIHTILDNQVLEMKMEIQNQENCQNGVKPSQCQSFNVDMMMDQADQNHHVVAHCTDNVIAVEHVVTSVMQQHQDNQVNNCNIPGSSEFVQVNQPSQKQTNISPIIITLQFQPKSQPQPQPQPVPLHHQPSPQPQSQPSFPPLPHPHNQTIQYPNNPAPTPTLTPIPTPNPNPFKQTPPQQENNLQTNAEVSKPAQGQAQINKQVVSQDAPLVIGSDVLDLNDINQIRELLLTSFPPSLRELTLSLDDEQLKEMYLEIRAEEIKAANERQQAQKQQKNQKINTAQQKINSAPQNQSQLTQQKDPQKQQPISQPRSQPSQPPQAPQSSTTPSPETQKKKQCTKQPQKMSTPSPQPGKPQEQSKQTTGETTKRSRKQKRRVITTVVQQIEYFDESDDGEHPSKYQVVENGDVKKKKSSHDVQTKNALGQLCGLIRSLDLSRYAQQS